MYDANYYASYLEHTLTTIRKYLFKFNNESKVNTLIEFKVRKDTNTEIVLVYHCKLWKYPTRAQVFGPVVDRFCFYMKLRCGKCWKIYGSFIGANV